MRDYSFPGGTAVVTGAASGIGEALAHALAARGSHLVLLDVDGDRLPGVVAAVRSAHPDVQVRSHVVDLADRAATAAVAAAVLTGSPRITLLVNNAGAATAGLFSQLDLDEFFWVMDVNFRATVHLTHALLPALTASPGSHVVNLSSTFGYLSPPGQLPYASSKFAIRGFSEGLRAELARDRVGVTTVHPGGIRTRLPQHTRRASGAPVQPTGAMVTAFSKVLRISAEDAAETILRGVERRRPRVLIGASAVVPDLFVRLLPGHYTTVLGLVTRVTSAVIGRSSGGRRRSA